MKTKTPPPLTLEITSNGSTVRIYGKRSTKGWAILEVTGASAHRLATVPLKQDAIQAALDCCDPDQPLTYHVKPCHS
jgi:hypothetical protein